MMNDRKLTVLTTPAGVLAVGEFGSSIIATWLLRSGRARAGAIFAGLLCLFEVVSFPGWQKHGALGWTTDIARPHAEHRWLVNAGLTFSTRPGAFSCRRRTISPHPDRKISRFSPAFCRTPRPGSSTVPLAERVMFLI
jgi:hypothetical protein